MARSPVSKEYCQSLLCVEVPVVVTLARKSIPVENVLKFVPGVMIQFDKNCDSPLAVEVGDQKIAEGEVVKVGDKFGLRVSNILPPEERFIPLHTAATKPN
ncbi:MAG: FliM/FliN family flagellar motor C-terminal domain-containing protein [Pirellulales bacterium]